MTTTKVTLTIRADGIDLARESMRSVYEALNNAGRDDFELEWRDHRLCWQSHRLSRFGEPRFEGGDVVLKILPDLGLPFLVGWVQSFIAAEVEWVEGWPILRSSPRDDGEDEPDPCDLTPDRLEPVA